MSPDGKNAVIGLKTFNTVLTDGLGLKKPLSADAEQGYLADFVAQERIRTGQMPLDFDRKTAMAVPVLDSNNQLTFHISVSDRRGLPVTQIRRSPRTTRALAPPTWRSIRRSSARSTTSSRA